MKNLQPHKYLHIHMKLGSAWSNAIWPVLLSFYTLCPALKREIRAVPPSGGLNTLVSSFQQLATCSRAGKHCLAVGPIQRSTSWFCWSWLSGLAAASLVSHFKLSQKHELQTSHSDNNATPMLGLHGFLSAALLTDSLTLTNSRRDESKLIC